MAETPPFISLCVITGNEEPTILRFLTSFKNAFDELCIVRAIGAQKPDGTLQLARRWCAENGKRYKSGEYHNQQVFTGRPGTDIDPNNPATWPHVDDFAAARNVAWKMATGLWQFWADVDDLLVEPPQGDTEKIGGSNLIRLCAAAGLHDFYLFKYSLRQQSESNVRERLFRTGISRWVQPVHEQVRCIADDDGKPGVVKACIEERVIYEHAPMHEKLRDSERNSRILKFALRWIHTFAFELHREWFYKWQAFRKEEMAEEATKWAEITLKTDCLAEQRYDAILNMAQIIAETDLDHAVDLCWSAIRIRPKLRAAWGDLARYHLKAGAGALAADATTFMQGLPKPSSSGYPMSEKYYGWQGADLRVMSLRAAGREADARKTEDGIFTANERRISLLHATRGRPEQAIHTRNLFLHGASIPLGVEHIFAIDEDDAASLAALKDYRHVVVKKPNGCVKAWNAAAAVATGCVLIQLSDDWVPPYDWDMSIWRELVKAARERRGADGAALKEPDLLRTTPLVLAVHDNHRTDDLLCMAIVTRARFEQQRDPEVLYGDHVVPESAPYLFSPEYFGVFSDNEFTVRAYKDGVVIQARHIIFNHAHPLYDGKKPEEWDETYKRQNDPARYEEGSAIFKRRNPEHQVK